MASGRRQTQASPHAAAAAVDGAVQYANLSSACPTCSLVTAPLTRCSITGPCADQSPSHHARTPPAGCDGSPRIGIGKQVITQRGWLPARPPLHLLLLPRLPPQRRPWLRLPPFPRWVPQGLVHRLWQPCGQAEAEGLISWAVTVMQQVVSRGASLACVRARL